MFKNIWKFNAPGTPGEKLQRILPVVLCAALILLSAIVASPDRKGLLIGGGITVLFIGIYILVRLINKRKLYKGAMNENLTPVMGKIMFNAVLKMPSPIFICDEEGRILWYNTATETLSSPTDKLYGAALPDLFGVSLQDIRDSKHQDSNLILQNGNRYFTPQYHHIKTDETDFYLVVTTEITEIQQLKHKITDGELAVAYIYIDNLAEMMQYDSENYRAAASKIDDILRRWANDCGGILKEYERDKYLFVMENRTLNACISRKFDILDKVRAVRVGDAELPMTISLGISNIHGSFEDKERAAHNALDMALQRGGDQAIVKSDASLDFYGGVTKTVQKRTNVRSRMVSGELVSAMKKASNVLIMGHRFADFDSFGACVGLARMAMFCGARVNIIVQMGDRNLSGCRELLASDSDFLGVLIDEAKALDLLETGTLVVVADVNNIAQMESKDIVLRTENLAIIDHHRLVAEFEHEPAIEYIEPSASSASELVTEMLEQVLPKDELSSQEASLLLAGINLDTQQFTKNAGTRTFSAAMFLRDCGANTEVIQTLNRTNLEDYLREARFSQNVILYRKNTAITCCAVDETETGPADRVIAAKAANNLLAVEGVEASFALVRIADTIHISARSRGKLNVQLILEQLKGGGHFDAAGAQIPGATMEEAIEMLKNAIDAIIG